MTTVVLNTVTRKVEVFSSARDVQARAEIADHKAAADPHPQYLADADLAEVALSGDAGDLIAGTVPDARMPNWTGYNLASRTALEAANVPAAVVGLRLLGRSAVGDGGGALYRRVAAEPAHAGKIQSADGAWWEIAENVLNVRQFGAVGDCTAVDTGTDDSTAFQKALDTMAAFGDGAILEVPHGRYRIASAVTVDLLATQGATFRMEGHVTPDSTLNRAFTIHNGYDVNLKLNVWGGGTLGDLSAATPASSGTECFVIRALRGAKIDVRAWSYAGRVLRVRRQQAGELKTSMLDIHMTTGDTISGHTRCGQSIYADDDGIGDAQGAWGNFSGTLFWDQYGPTFEDLNDVHIRFIEGSFRLQTLELRGCKGVNADFIYIGDTGIAGGGNDCDAVVIKASTTAVARSPERHVIDQVRCLKSRRGVYISTPSSSPSIRIGSIQANQTTQAALYLEGCWWVSVGCVAALSCGQAVHITGTCREISIDTVQARGSAVTEDQVFIGSGVDRSRIGALYIDDGASTKSLVRKEGGGEVHIGYAALRGSTVAELVHLVEVENGLHLLGGKFVPGGSTTSFNSGRRPKTMKHVSGYKTLAYGSATILSGNTSITVNHGLARTPANVKVTPRHAEVSDAIVASGISSTSFSVQVASAVTADRSFMWEASAELA